MTRFRPLAFALVISLAVSLPAAQATADQGASAPTADAAKKKKKKCKRVKVKKKNGKIVKRCKKKKKKQSGPAWVDGRYQGNYATSNATLAFNVQGNRLFTGPFDSFYVEATCRNSDPNYTGDQTYSDSTAIGPVEARISGGRFSGSGVYRPSAEASIPWEISGRISGKTITDGVFTVNYKYSTSNDPCTGTARFTANWYGAYTL